MMKNRVLPILIALIATVALLPGCTGSDAQSMPEKKAPKVVKISFEEVKPVIIRDILVLPGETEPDHDVTVASELDGLIEWIGPKEGQLVKKGELIARIDSDVQKASLDRAQATYALAKDLAERRANLHKRKSISKEDMDRASTEKTQALTSLREAKVRYDQSMVRSPINGVVNKLYLDPGEFAKRGEPLAELVNVDTIRINVSVPEVDVRYLKVGQKAHIRVDAFPEEHWIGDISFISFKADDGTKTFQVRVLVNNSDGRIRPGMIARAAFLRRELDNVITAPLFAIIDKGGERIVFVDEDGTAKARTVSLGVIEGDRIQITKGLKQGDRLIVTGHKQIEEGTKVQAK